MYHQMHCLVAIQDGIRGHKVDGHVHHCLNYLRQMILCDANPTLERAVEEFGTRAIDSRTERVCRDWSKVYALAESNHREWKQRRKHSGSNNNNNTQDIGTHHHSV